MLSIGGWAIDSVQGTGTAAGDPLEFAAINAVFKGYRSKADSLIVGSVKSNIGHLESSSALASFVKVVQCLEKGSIPAQLHFNNPNPGIDFQNVTIPKHVQQCPETSSGVRRAAINTFGAGGTNGHAVLEAFSSNHIRKGAPENRPFLLKVSATDDTSISAMSLAYADYAERSRPDPRDLAHTLLSRRSTLRRSRFFVASSLEQMILRFREGSRDRLASDREGGKRIIFLFTGQGAQWPQMGTRLMQNSPIFRAVLEECDRCLSTLPDGPSWSLSAELSKAKDVTNIYKAEYSQPLCTALQLGIVTLLKSWGITADAVVGHSSGEIAAAYAAGKISLRDAIIISYYRGLVLSKATLVCRGSMCAVGLDEATAGALAKSYGDRVQLATINSPTSCTLSGDSDAIQKIIAQLGEKSQFCRELRVDQGK